MNPWDRQAYENEEAWTAFRQYRDSAPPRKALRSTGAPSYLLVARWFRENFWAERVTAYDNHLDAIRQEEAAAATRQSAKDVAAKHMRVLQDMGDLTAREVEKLLDASKSGQAVGLLKPNEIVKMIDATIKFDRLVRELPTEIVDNRQPDVDLSKLSPDDLRKLAELRRKLAGGSE